MADARTGAWDAELVAQCGLDLSCLPTLADSQEIVGTTTQTSGLKAGIPVVQGAIDTSLEFLCCAPLDAQTASLKLASAGVLSCGTDTPAPQPPVSFYPHILPDAWYHAAGMSACTGALDWMRTQFFDNCDYAALEALAQTATRGANGVLFHPYLEGARAPHWDTKLTADLSGLTHATTRADIARAAYEGIGFAFLDIWRHMETCLNAPMPKHLHLLGGGAHSPFWAQMLADMLNADISVGQHNDASFAGALLAGYGAGAFASLAEAARAGYHEAARFTPDKAAHTHYSECHANYDARRIGLQEGQTDD